METTLTEFEFKAKGCKFQVDAKVNYTGEECERSGNYSLEIYNVELTDAWKTLEGCDPTELNLKCDKTRIEIEELLGDSEELGQFIEQEILEGS